MLNKIPEFDHY